MFGCKWEKVHAPNFENKSIGSLQSLPRSFYWKRVSFCMKLHLLAKPILAVLSRSIIFAFFCLPGFENSQLKCETEPVPFLGRKIFGESEIKAKLVMVCWHLSHIVVCNFSFKSWRLPSFLSNFFRGQEKSRLLLVENFFVGQSFGRK